MECKTFSAPISKRKAVLKQYWKITTIIAALSLSTIQINSRGLYLQATRNAPFAFPPYGFNVKFSNILRPAVEHTKIAAPSYTYGATIAYPNEIKQSYPGSYLADILKSELLRTDLENESFRAKMIGKTQYYLKKLDIHNQDISKQLEFLKEQKDLTKKHSEQ